MYVCELYIMFSNVVGVGHGVAVSYDQYHRQGSQGTREGYL